MKLLKSLLVAVMLCTLTACGSTNNESKEPIKILAPTGATALSLLGLYGDENVTIDTIDGSDVLSAELAKSDSSYDAIIAPINLGSKLITSDKSDYVLNGIVTWGNLYIVGDKSASDNILQTEGSFAAFGEKAVPQKVLMSSMDMMNIKLDVVYYNSVNDVAQQLLSGQVKVGLLAEPAATTVITKAKENGLNLDVIVDLQKAYQEKNNTENSGYPQAALFVKKGSNDKVAGYIETAKTFANKTAVETPDKINEAVEVATADKLGVASGDIAKATWTRQNIHITDASEVKGDIETFLKQFDITVTDKLYTND